MRQFVVIGAITIDLETHERCTNPTLLHVTRALWEAHLPQDNLPLACLTANHAHSYARMLRDAALQPINKYRARCWELGVWRAGFALYDAMDRAWSQLNVYALRRLPPGFELPVEYQEIILADLSASVRARIRQPYGRLAATLRENKTTLEDELPSAIYEALSEITDMPDLDKFRNRVANLIAGPERRAERDRGADLPIDDLPVADDFAARELARIEDRDLLDRTEFTDRQREMLVLDDDGYSGKEIAEKLGTTEGTVNVTLHRARKKHRQTA